MDDVNISELHSLREQLRICREARARWEGTANILAGEVRKHAGGSIAVHQAYGMSVLEWAWEQTSGQN
jgi:hypothetical protein